VSCAVVHTFSPAQVAQDALKITGIELSAYLAGDEVVVLRGPARACIAHSDAGYRYRAEGGDPLEIQPALDDLARQGKVGPDGFVDDRLLFEATKDGVYPDGVARLWRAFHGLVVYTPDVMLSIADGYHVGSPSMYKVIKNLVGIHGSLRANSSTGFAMTMACDLPPAVRQADLLPRLRELGVPIRGVGPNAPAQTDAPRAATSARAKPAA